MMRTEQSYQRSGRFTWLLVLWAVMPSVPAVADEPGVTMDIERTASASPEEMAAFADAAQTQQAQNLKRTAKLDEDVRRKARDGLGLDCVTNNLTAVRVLLDVTKDAASKMKERLAAGNKDRANSDLRTIAISLKESNRLTSDAERCALGLGVQQGKDRREVEGEVGDPDQDVAPQPSDLLDYGYDPSSASPF